MRVRPRRLLARWGSRRVDHRVLPEQHEVAFAAEMDDRRESSRLARPGNGAVERPVELDRGRVALDAGAPTGDARKLPDVDRGEHRVPRGRQPVEAFAEAELDAACAGASDEQFRDPPGAALDARKAVALAERREQEPEGAAEDAPRRDVRVERIAQEQPVRRAGRAAGAAASRRPARARASVPTALAGTASRALAAARARSAPTVPSPPARTAPSSSRRGRVTAPPSSRRATDARARAARA